MQDDLTAPLSNLTAGLPLLYKDSRMTPAHPSQGLQAGASVSVQPPARRAAFRHQVFCSPWKSPNCFWGSLSLSHQDSKLPRTPQDELLHSRKTLGRQHLHLLSQALPGRLRQQLRRKPKECKRNTWEAPMRRTFGSRGGHGVLNISKTVPKCAKESLHLPLNMQIPD